MSDKLKYRDMIEKISSLKKESLPVRQAGVQSDNLCKSVIQTSYDIVKAHGGGITVESNKNKSTIFTISLPYNS